MNLTSLDLDEYDQLTQAEIGKRRVLARDFFFVAAFFLLLSVVAMFYSATIIAGILFFISLFCKDLASEARSEISMIETNWQLALLVNKQSSELATIKSYLSNLKEVSKSDCA